MGGTFFSVKESFPHTPFKENRYFILLSQAKKGFLNGSCLKIC